MPRSREPFIAALIGVAIALTAFGQTTVERIHVDEAGADLEWKPVSEDHGYTVEERERLESGVWAEAEGDWPILEHSWFSGKELSSTQRFFRIRAALLNPPYLASSKLADGDEDGLSDYQEAEIGTDPQNPDTDHDGLLDGYEVFLSTHPLYASLGLDPLNIDSDGDNVGDFHALRALLAGAPFPDTGKTDSDGDLLTDNQEIFLGTDPHLSDTDADGTNDFAELTQGSNPKDPDDAGGLAFYMPYIGPEQYDYRTFPNLIGSEYDSLADAYGFIEPEPASPSSDSARVFADGNTPIGTGDGGRPIFLVYVVELKDGRKAGRVPTSVCASGYLLLKEGVTIHQEMVTIDGETRPMWTIKPFDQITPQERQQCCVQGDLLDDPESLVGQLVELFGDDLEVIRTTVNFILAHGLLVFDQEDKDRFYNTRNKFIRCCGFSKSKATAISMAILVFVNIDSISTAMLFGALPFNIGSGIDAVDRQILDQAIGQKTDGIIDDAELTQAICDIILWYHCRDYIRANSPVDCPGFDDLDLARAVAEDRANGAGEGRPAGDDDGNPEYESTGGSIPPDYGRGAPPENNPKGNQPPPGGAKDAAEGKKVGDGKVPDGDGAGGGNGGGNGGGEGGGNRGGKKDGPGPGGGTPGGPILTPGIPPDDEIFPSIWYHEYGDAPEAGLSAAYPSPNDSILGKFPTRRATENSRYSLPGGHILYPGYIWLGRRFSGERDALSGDTDPEPNLDIGLALSNRDYFDDGLVLPLTVNTCAMTSIHVAVSSWRGVSLTEAYVNVLIDFNRNGEWKGSTDGAAEWAVVNKKILLVPGSEQIVALPAFQTPCSAPFPAWTRIVLSDLPLDPATYADGGWDGSGAFNFGEVEDYFIE